MGLPSYFKVRGSHFFSSPCIYLFIYFSIPTSSRRATVDPVGLLDLVRSTAQGTDVHSALPDLAFTSFHLQLCKLYKKRSVQSGAERDNIVTDNICETRYISLYSFSDGVTQVIFDNCVFPVFRWTIENYGITEIGDHQFTKVNFSKN